MSAELNKYLNYIMEESFVSLNFEVSIPLMKN